MKHLISLIFILLCSSLSVAEEGDPCTSDREKFCGKINIQEGKKIIQCMNSHGKDLSQACKDHWASAKGIHEIAVIERRWGTDRVALKAKMQKACAKDIAKYCPHPKDKEEGRLCLQSKKDKLEKPCQAAFDKLQKLASDWDDINLCLVDMRKTCKNPQQVKKLGPLCLKDYNTSVSPGCEATLAKLSAKKK
jgi:hypothetical protein